MEEDTVLLHLVSKINEDIKALEYDLSRGACPDFATYKFVCGRIAGLVAAKIHIVDLKERLEKDNDY